MKEERHGSVVAEINKREMWMRWMRRKIGEDVELWWRERMEGESCGRVVAK